MDPHALIDQASAGVSAPLWFVEFFKVLGFALHAVPMCLWYAGLPIALGLYWFGNEHARRFAVRLLRQMPIVVAVGINLGIVPLLFVQLAYHKTFYPATILMAWPWLSIIVLLIPAYYGVYACAGGLGGLDDSRDAASRSRGAAGWRIAAGWLAALLFLCIGFLFVNGISLMDHPDRWPELWRAHGHAGAALGTAMNTGDVTFWPRWLLMLGLAIETTAVWLLVDTAWLARSAADEAYRRWAWRFARKLYTAGMLWAAAAGTWYVFGSWSAELRAAMFGWPIVPLTGVTAIAAGLPWLLLMRFNDRSAARAVVAAIAASQFGVLGINAVSRQVVQNINLMKLAGFDVLSQPTDVQWGPLAMFLIVFVLGLIVVGWMLAQLKYKT